MLYNEQKEKLSKVYKRVGIRDRNFSDLSIQLQLRKLIRYSS